MCFHKCTYSQVIVFGNALYRFTYQDVHFWILNPSNMWLLLGDFSLLLIWIIVLEPLECERISRMYVWMNSCDKGCEPWATTNPNHVDGWREGNLLKNVRRTNRWQGKWHCFSPELNDVWPEEKNKTCPCHFSWKFPHWHPWAECVSYTMLPNTWMTSSWWLNHPKNSGGKFQKWLKKTTTGWLVVFEIARYSTRWAPTNYKWSYRRKFK